MFPTLATLYNIYIDHITSILKEKLERGITINSNTTLNPLLFADNLAIIQTNGGDMQRSVYTLRKNIASKCQDKKIKLSHFRGRTQYAQK